MIVEYFDENFYHLFQAEQNEEILHGFTEVIYQNNLFKAKFDGKDWVEGLTSQEIDELDGIDAEKYIYNNLFELCMKDDFSIWSNFFLNSVAEINLKGDKSKITWKNADGIIAIEEFPTYTRWTVGAGMTAKSFLKRDLTVKYYRQNGTFSQVVLPTKIYNEKERIDNDKKSRNNIIEACRSNTGAFIYKSNLIANTPQLISPQINEALNMLKTLQAVITVYREDREYMPLVKALQDLTPTALLPQTTINFIINQVNINYY